MDKGAVSGESKNTLYCSFCGKSQHEVRKLIAGPTVFICDECVELCMDIIREEAGHTKTGAAEAQAALDLVFPSFEAARRALSALEMFKLVPTSDAPRILLSGPFGSGKRIISQSACDWLGLPCLALSGADLRVCAAAQQTVVSVLQQLTATATAPARVCLIIDGAEHLALQRGERNHGLQAELAAALSDHITHPTVRLTPSIAAVFLYTERDDPDVTPQEALLPELRSLFCQQATLPLARADALATYLHNSPTGPFANLTRRLQDKGIATDFAPEARDALAAWCARRYGFRSIDAATRRVAAALLHTRAADSAPAGRIAAAEVDAALD